MQIIPPKIPELDLEKSKTKDSPVVDPETDNGIELSNKNFNPIDRKVIEGGTLETNNDFELHERQQKDQNEAPSFSRLVEAHLNINNPVVSEFKNADYDALVFDPDYMPEEDPIFIGLEHHSEKIAFSPNAEASVAIAQNLRREEEEREVMKNASLAANLAAGVGTELFNPTTIAMMFFPLAKGASALTQAVKWGSLGISQEAINEALLHKSQLLRTKEETASALIFAGVINASLGGTVAHFGGKGSMVEAGRDLYKYMETGKIKDAPLKATLKDNPIGDAVGVASGRIDSAGAMRATPNINNVLSDYALTPIGRRVREILPEDYVPLNGPSKLKGNPITRTSESPILSVRQNTFNLVDSPYYHQAHADGKIVGQEIGSIESRVALHQADYNQLKMNRRDAYMRYRNDENTAINRVKASVNDVVGNTEKQGVMTQIQFREEISRAVDNYGKHPNKIVAEQARESIKYFESIKKDLIDVGLLDDTFKTGDTSSYLHRIYDRNVLIKYEDEFVGILVDHWQSMQGEYIAKTAGIKASLRSQESNLETLKKELDDEILDTPKRDLIEKKLNEATDDIPLHLHEINLQQKLRDSNTEKLEVSRKITTKINTLIEKQTKLRVETKKAGSDLVNNTRRKETLEASLEKAPSKGVRFKQTKQKLIDHNKLMRDWEKKNRSIMDALKKQSDEVDANIQKLKDEDANLKLMPDETFRRRIEAEKAALVKARKFVSEQKKRLGKEARIVKKKKRESIVTAEKNIAKKRAELDENLSIAGLSRADLKASAIETTDKIKGTPIGQTAVDAIPDIHVFKAGALKNRVLDIPREKIEKFLENDIDVIQRSYQRAMSPRIELARDYGDVDMKDLFQLIKDDYKNLLDDKVESMKQAGDSAEDIAKMRLSIQKFKERDEKDLLALRDKLLGTYNQPADPNHGWWRFLNSVRSLNFMSMLGQMTISAIPDFARVVMVQGFTPTLRGLRGYLDKDLRQMTQAELRKSNVGFESIMNSRAYKMADIVDDAMYATKLERGIGASTDIFAKATGMTVWNDTLKTFSGAMIQDGMLRAILSNTPNKRQIRELAKNGIEMDGDIANTIRELAKKHGKVDGDLYTSGGIDWLKGLKGEKLNDAMKAQSAFRTAIIKSVNETVITVGIGEMPLWMGNNIAKQVMQFKSFAVSSHARALHSGLQVVDQQRVEALVLAMGLGAIVMETKALINDKPTNKDNAGNYMLEVADRAGILGYTGEVHNYAGQMTGGAADVKNIWGGGGGKLSKYKSRNMLENLAGPSAGLLSNVQSVSSATLTGEWTEQDDKAARRMLPFNNLVWWNWALNRYNGSSD